ncbi:MAG: AraC family transcriptional regulator [Sphingomonadales bacterium]|nr:MAG: AraC family transcriptional regulator [Sphingomonadales bacterium]
MIDAVMDRIHVSPEMVMHIGAGQIGEGDWPAQPVAFVFDFAAANFVHHARPTTRLLDREADRARLVLIVARDAVTRLVGCTLDMDDNQRFHIPPTLRSIVFAARDCAFHEAARIVYRGAKGIEALCELLQLHQNGDLMPFGAAGTVSLADSQRLMVARRFIEDRWAEKLTLDTIARASGLNRAKLTRGFRDLFSCSVADAIVQQRLGEAKQMLLVTDLPVSSIGYRCGYLNNASFARAFSRHYGVAPTQYRATRMAA